MPAVRDPLARLSIAEIERRLGVMGQVSSTNLSSLDRRLKKRLQTYSLKAREGA